MSHEANGSDVGSVAEEAARLIGLLAGGLTEDEARAAGARASARTGVCETCGHDASAAATTHSGRGSAGRPTRPGMPTVPGLPGDRVRPRDQPGDHRPARRRRRHGERGSAWACGDPPRGVGDTVGCGAATGRRPVTAYTIGIDIGGTKVAGGVVDEAGTVHARARAETPHRSTSPAIVEDVIAGVVERLAETAGPGGVAAVGIGAAGFVSADRSTVTFSPHLSWRNEPLREAVQNRTGLPTTWTTTPTRPPGRNGDSAPGGTRRTSSSSTWAPASGERSSSRAGSSGGATGWPASSGTCRSCPEAGSASAATAAAGSSTPAATRSCARRAPGSTRAAPRQAPCWRRPAVIPAR